MTNFLIDAKTEEPIRMDRTHRLLVDAYEASWLALHKSKPSGWHPLPEGVGSDDVEIFIVFSERLE